jgi:hypothetical protein
VHLAATSTTYPELGSFCPWSQGPYQESLEKRRLALLFIESNEGARGNQSYKVQQRGLLRYNLLVLWTSSILVNLHGKKIMTQIWVDLLPSTTIY